MSETDDTIISLREERLKLEKESLELERARFMAERSRLAPSLNRVHPKGFLIAVMAMMLVAVFLLGYISGSFVSDLRMQRHREERLRAAFAHLSSNGDVSVSTVTNTASLSFATNSPRHSVSVVVVE